jgi:DNA-binding transcriptional LysR family regulator
MRRLNLDQLKAYVEVADRGSFTAAAKALNLSQPAVTHQVHELEQRFKVALLERLGKRAYPTEAGEKLIEHARQLLDEDEHTNNSMRRFSDGWLGRSSYAIGPHGCSRTMDCGSEQACYFVLHASRSRQKT